MISQKYRLAFGWRENKETNPDVVEPSSVVMIGTNSNKSSFFLVGCEKLGKYFSYPIVSSTFVFVLAIVAGVVIALF